MAAKHLHNKRMTAPEPTSPDIDFTLEDFRFSMRAAVILIHGGKLLVCREPDLDVCYLPGGRIQFGEDSLAAARRELLEETGQVVGPLRLSIISEDFFESASGPYQGIALYYVAESPPSFPAKPFEGHWFEWVSLDALDGAGLVPPFLRSAVLNLPSEGVRHLVSRR